jgi:hypothetical protein
MASRSLPSRGDQMPQCTYMLPGLLGHGCSLWLQFSSSCATWSCCPSAGSQWTCRKCPLRQLQLQHGPWTSSKYAAGPLVHAVWDRASSTCQCHEGPAKPGRVPKQPRPDLVEAHYCFGAGTVLVHVLALRMPSWGIGRPPSPRPRCPRAD